MNPEERFRQLAERARLETPPRVDVANRVMAQLRSLTEENGAVVRPLAWVAAFSTATAVALALLALPAWQTLNDPVVKILLSSTGGMP